MKIKGQQLSRIILLLLLVIAVVYTLVFHREALNLNALRDFLSQYGPLAPLVFIAIYAFATVLLLPGTLLTITGGLLFGAFWGVIYNICGATLGAAMAFLIARYIGADWLAQRSGGRIKMLLRGVKKEGWRFVAVLRLMPFAPFNILNYAFGLTGISLAAYVIPSAIFTLPGCIAYSYLGSLGETFIYGDAREIITKASIGIGLLVLLSVLPYFIKRFRSHNEH